MVKVTLEGQTQCQGEDYVYRNNTNITVEQDIEDDEQLNFNIDNIEFFMKKEDLKKLIYLFEI